MKALKTLCLGMVAAGMLLTGCNSMTNTGKGALIGGGGGGALGAGLGALIGGGKGAGIGAGIYKDNNEAFATLEKLNIIEPNVAKHQEYADAYAKWKYRLEKSMVDKISIFNSDNK